MRGGVRVYRKLTINELPMERDDKSITEEDQVNVIVTRYISLLHPHTVNNDRSLILSIIEKTDLLSLLSIEVVQDFKILNSPCRSLSQSDCQ